MDRQNIEEQVKRVLQYSQNVNNPKITELMDNWETNKKKFFKAFGNKLIYEFDDPVSLELNPTVKEQKVVDFAHMIVTKWKNQALAEFVMEQEDGFFDNRVVSDWTLPSGKIITKGTKLLRSFKHFLEDRALHDVQTEASRVIQENKIEGKLCISIHPLDFLSSSENIYNWRSCHALDGEFRAGNLSYIGDGATFVCYIKGAEDVILPHFPGDIKWNSKKWRVLMFLSDDDRLIFAGRQYPFELSNGLDYILENFIQKVFIDSPEARFGCGKYMKWSKWTDKMVKSIYIDGIQCNCEYEYLPLGNGLAKLSNVVIDAPESRHFNDVLGSSCYVPVYTFKYMSYDDVSYSVTNTHHTLIHVGQKVKCINCGETTITSDGDTMMCWTCFDSSYSEDRRYCNCCDGSYYYDEGEWIGDDWICENCLNKHFSECEVCGVYEPNDSIVYCEEEEKYMCQCCYEDWKSMKKEEEEKGEYE